MPTVKNWDLRYRMLTACLVLLLSCAAMLPAADIKAEVHDSIEPVSQPWSSGRAQVERVHAYFNSLKRVSDWRMWGRKDYWATTSELLQAGGGDCEDIAAAKYFALRELGVPSSQLRLVYARVFTAGRHRIEPHVVLWYQPAQGAEWLVLDSLRDDILALSLRGDLLPSLTFNEDLLARWLDSGVEQVLGGSDLLQSWNMLLTRQQALDTVALVLTIHTL